MVKKLATALNARLHHPDKDMSVGSKIELVESYLGENSNLERSKVVFSQLVPQDAHQRDALAASIRTYKNYQKKLDQIESRSLDLNLNHGEIDQIKRMVIEGTAISKAIRRVQEMQGPVDEEINMPEDLANDKVDSPLNDNSILKLKNKVKNQATQINNLINKNTSLEEKIEDYQREIDKLNDKIDKLHFDYTQGILEQKELLSKISLIKKLQDKYNQEMELRIKLEKNLDSLRNIQMINPTENAIPIKIVESFTRDGINEACEYWKIKRGDVVLLKSSEGGGSQTASLLINMGVKAVLIPDKISHNAREEFEKNLVPLLQSDDMELEMIDQFAIINALKLEKEIEKWKEKTENKRIEENNQEILKVFDEYRARRKRNID